MVFSSVYFVFIFLPLTVLLYTVVPQKIRNLLLVAASIIFYAWGSPSNLLFLLFSCAFNYLAGLQMDLLITRNDRRSLQIVTITTAAADILILALFKYVVHTMPLGLSFYTFMVLSYIFDLYQGRARAEKNILRFLLYVTFFAKVTSGPIEQFASMQPMLASRTVKRTDLISGLQLFLIGLFKKVLLADNLGAAFAAVTASTSRTVLGSWLAMIFYSLQLYYDFSGYSDMAIGIASMFGFRFGKNFDHPYLSKTIAEFWRRWHISLGNWFKQYVYFPMGGSRVPPLRIFLNLLTVWILTGIWHGNTLGFVVWGLYHGAFVILERFVFRDHFDGIPVFVRILVTDLIAFIGWVFFYSPAIGDALGTIGGLVGIGAAAAADNTSLFALRGYLLILIAAFAGATELPLKVRDLLFSVRHPAMSGTVKTALTTAFFVILTLCSVACMLGSTYSSFLYFKF